MFSNEELAAARREAIAEIMPTDAIRSAAGVTSEYTRLSIASRARILAEEHGVSYATSQTSDGRLVYVIGDQVVTPGTMDDWMKSLGY